MKIVTLESLYQGDTFLIGIDCTTSTRHKFNPPKIALFPKQKQSPSSHPLVSFFNFTILESYTVTNCEHILLSTNPELSFPNY